MTAIIPIPDITGNEHVTQITSTDQLEIGRWFWVKDDDKDSNGGSSPDWLGCVMEIGSNYLKLHSPHRWETRVHFDDFFTHLRHEPKAQEVIAQNVKKYQDEAQRLMHEVKALTARLGVAPRVQIAENSTQEQHALAVLSGQGNVKDYEKALIKAKDKILPELFEKIKKANEQMAAWMNAEALPMKAAVKGMEGSIDCINDRIFNVSLYAGLTETVVKCQDGEPAEISAKLHVMQRRLYMDEECLLNYATGGMEFTEIKAFDQWLCKPENLHRMLPFPRCLVAMRVRRINKEREWHGSLREALIRFKLEQADKLTFLYLRNGEQVYRLDTSLEFDEMIFPDKSFFDPGEEKMFKMWCGRKVEEIISRHEYDTMVEAKKERKLKSSQWERENPEETWDRESKGPWEWANPYQEDGFGFRASEWEPFNPSSVYYDDVAATITAQIKKYNRISLIIQGLFDRSPVFHPHPLVQTWTPEGFEAAVKLVYDGKDILYAGEKPDFEAYRRKCNESLNADSVVIGQEDFWMAVEAEKENERQANDWRNNNPSNYKRYRPHGNPGPGFVARIDKWHARTKKATFRWTRERMQYSYHKDDQIPCVITVPTRELFNVNAYQPGDYKQFFADPRTRAEYLKWAPLLLGAEEYHAGNLELGGLGQKYDQRKHE